MASELEAYVEDLRATLTADEFAAAAAAAAEMSDSFTARRLDAAS